MYIIAVAAAAVGATDTAAAADVDGGVECLPRRHRGQSGERGAVCSQRHRQTVSRHCGA